METCEPEKVHKEMVSLLKTYNAKKKKELDDILDFHQKFESIHPFQDGNGRVGRLIMFKECLAHGIVPFIITEDLRCFYFRGLQQWPQIPDVEKRIMKNENKIQQMARNSALFKLHLSVLVAGGTGLFGRLVSLQEIPLVWYRLLLTTALLIPILYLQKKLQFLPWHKGLKLMGVGALLGVHWVFFYASIQASNVSIGVICMALLGMFTALLDPLVNRHRFYAREMLLSSLSLIGLVLIFQLDTRYRVGILLGVAAQFLAASFSVCSKKVLTVHPDIPTRAVVLYEMLGGFICLSIILPLTMYYRPELPVCPLPLDWLYLFILAFVCTIGQYMLQFAALKHISTFTMNLTYNLEPIYSIILAMIIFNESRELNASFYVGLVLIIASVIIQNLLQRKKS